MAFPTKGINSRQWAGSSCSLQEIVAGRRIHSAYSFTALVCALHLARVTALGAIANADGDEIDLVAVQHEVPRDVRTSCRRWMLFQARSTRKSSTARTLGPTCWRRSAASNLCSRWLGLSKPDVAMKPAAPHGGT